MIQDLRYAVRMLRKTPGITALVVVTMAVGIGATTMLFSVGYGVLLKPLPWPGADRLVRITETRKGQPARIRGTLTNGAYLAWSDHASTVEGIGGYFATTVTATLSGTNEPARMQLASVTPTLLPLLNVHPLRGRLFEPSEGPTGGRGANAVADVIIVSYGLWQEWFGGREDAIGRVMQIDGKPVKVVGVMPRDFVFPDRDTRAWRPMAVGSVLGEQGVRRIVIFSALARLRAGVTPARAAAEATARARSGADPGLAAIGMFGSAAPPDISVTPAVEAMTAEVKPAIVVLLAAVALLLATAIANVGSLQLARATTRRREFAVRAAIGAGVARITRQLVVESLILGLSGGVAGLLMTVAVHRALPSLLPADFPRATDITIDARVLLFALAVSVATSVACGLLPSALARRIDLVEALTDDTAASAAGAWHSRGGRLRTFLMAGQVAVACLLLIGGGLLVRSFIALIHADRGYDPSNVLTARVDLPAGYDAARRVAFADALVARVREVPGVTHAAAGTALPFVTSGGSSAFEMRSPRDPAIKLQVGTFVRTVSPDYFRALRLRLVEGRTLSGADTITSRPVIVVNRSFARRYLGDPPLGAVVPLPFGEGRPDCDVVGVVEDMRQGDVTDPPAPEVFASYRQLPNRLMNARLMLVMRTATDPAAYVRALRASVREQDPMLAVDSIMTLEERVMTSLAKPHIYAVLLSAFGTFALVIAGVGLFGVLSYAVAQRSREIGVRTALGARPWNIIGLVLRQALVIAIGGLSLGVWAAYALARYVASFLYGVTPHDTVSFVAVPLLLFGVATVACIIPARRAAAVDPLTALRAR